MNLTYVCSPYSHPKSSVQDHRFRMVCEFASKLMKKGWHVFSPIAHCHPIAQYGLPGDYEYWQDYCDVMLSRCDFMIVYAIDGWDLSKGVQAEIIKWGEYNKPIFFLTDESEIPEPIR